MRRLIARAVFLLVFVQAAQAQQSSVSKDPQSTSRNPYTLRTSTNLVILDVAVTDKNDRPVSNLSAEDFTVRENGKTQKIRSFERPSEHALPSSLSINSTYDLDRLAPQAPVNIIVLDEFNTRFEDMASVRYFLKKYLSQQKAKLEQPTMLMAVTLGHFIVLQDYTQNKKSLEEAMDDHLTEFPWQRGQAGWAPDQYSTAFATILQVAEASAGHPGHKNLIWVGRGFPDLSLVDSPAATVSSISTAIEFCINILRDARITLYSIDPVGLTSASPLLRTYGPLPGAPGISSSPQPMDRWGLYDDPTALGNFRFNTLVRATGGKAFHGKNDINNELSKAIQDGSNFYTLSYVPGETKKDPAKFRKIEVSVNRSNAVATTRKGYYVQPPAPPENLAKPSERLQFDLLAAANSRLVYSAVPITATPKDGSKAIYIVHIAGTALGQDAGFSPGSTIDLAFIAAIFDQKDKLLRQIARNITKQSNASLTQNGLNIEVSLHDVPSRARIRFVVRTIETGKMGTADLTSVASP